MGAIFNCGTCDDMSHEEAREFGQALIDEARREHGADGDTGTFAEANAIDVSDTYFTTLEDAETWLYKRADRYGPLRFVRVYEPDKAYWAYGLWCRC